MPFFSTYGVSFGPVEVGYRATNVFVSDWIEYFGGQCQQLKDFHEALFEYFPLELTASL
jgi:hypothetical protein